MTTLRDEFAVTHSKGGFTYVSKSAADVRCVPR